MPPMQLDENYQPRPWTCDRCAQILGVVMRDASRVRRLWVFGVDLEPDCTLPPVDVLRNPPRGLFKLHGVDQAQGVECSRCGARNEWTMSKESYLRLVSYYGQAK